MNSKPQWMDQDDWTMLRIERTKDNMDAGGKLVDKQTTEVEFYKVKCNGPFCGRTFFEFEALGHCPHCAAKLEGDNGGVCIKIVLEINTLTGKVEIKDTTK